MTSSPPGGSTRTLRRLAVAGSPAAKNQSPCHSLPLPPMAALGGAYLVTRVVFHRDPKWREEMARELLGPLT